MVFHLEVIWSTILPWYAVVSVGSVGGCSLQVTRCRPLPEALVKHAHLPGTPRREGSKQFREAFGGSTAKMLVAMAKWGSCA